MNKTAKAVRTPSTTSTTLALFSSYFEVFMAFSFFTRKLIALEFLAIAVPSGRSSLHGVPRLARKPPDYRISTG